MTEASTLDVSIRTRSKILFEGKIYSVTSFNVVGEFDVLPQHANFVSLVKNNITLDKGLKTEKKFDIESGVMSVTKDKVAVYLGV